jgi:NuA3 HAT complex component NTO1
VVASVSGLDPAEMTATYEHQANGSFLLKTLPADQREGWKLAGRVLRAVNPLLAEAKRKELELGGPPYEKELEELDSELINDLLLRRNSIAASLCEDGSDDGLAMRDISANSVVGLEREDADDIKDIDMKDVILDTGIDVHDEDAPGEDVDDDTYFLALPANDSMDVENTNGEPTAEEIQLSEDQNTQFNLALPKDGSETGASGLGTTEHSNGVGGDIKDIAPSAELAEYQERDASYPQPTPPTPPSSSEDEEPAPFAHGGIPWYMKPFDPIGTTIHEERWTGREVLRGMSEELSELDDDEIRGLVDPDGSGQEVAGVVDTAAPSRKKANKRAKGGRRSRNYR